MRQPEVFHTTAFRWALLVAAFLAAGSLLRYGFIYKQMVADVDTRTNELLVSELKAMAADPPEVMRILVRERPEDDPRHEQLFGLFDVDHRVLAGNFAVFPPRLPPQGVPGVLTVTRAGEHGPESQLAHVAALRLPSGQILVVGLSTQRIDELRRIFARALGLGLLPAIVLSLAAGVLLGLRSQRRLSDVAGTAERIMAGNFSARLPVRGGDDIQRLAKIVNRMLDEIERLMHEIRDVGDEIAHDLRTPLTRVRMRLERARDSGASPQQLVEAIDRAIAGIDQALGIITALLRIAEIEHGHRRASFASVDMAAVLREAAELYEPIAEDRGLALRLDLAPVPAIFGDRELLLELVANLVDNAVKFTPAGGTVTLTSAPAPQGPMLCIADTGPGIDDSERQAVLRRFYRADKSRHTEGTGLGLSLASAIARLHGFALSIREGSPGCIVELACWPQRPAPGDGAERQAVERAAVAAAAPSARIAPAG